jgi:uncharacterized protein involved in outer membrane biogenesis
MKKQLIRGLIGVVVLLVVAVAVTALFLGSIVKKGIETIGPTLTKTEVKLDSASLSVLSGSGQLKGFVLGNPEGYRGEFAIKVGRVELGVKPGSVFSDKIHVTHIRVDRPEIRFDGNPLSPKHSNLGKILENLTAATGPSHAPAKTEPAAPGSARKLQVDEVLITGGKVEMATVLTAGQPLTFPLPDIHFTDLGQGSDGITAADLGKKVMGEITDVAFAAVLKNAGSASQGAVHAAETAVRDITGARTNGLKGIGDLFKKKN